MDFGKVNVSMSTDEAIRVKTLMDRDESRAVIKVSGTFESGDSFSYLKCPACEEVVLSDSKFCRKCGQRLDVDNFEF